jgi:phosphoribosylformimino-5-aminoimidazole carboxamide ribotide isomerase
MRIIPVLDLQHGVVVRGVGGNRHAYRPVTSCLTTSCFPVTIARAFRDHFGLNELYLADLDAITGGHPALEVYAELLSAGFGLWVDAGVRRVADARPLAAAGVGGIVAGLETLAGPDALEALCREFGAGRIIFSLDLKDSRPMGNVDVWDAPEIRTIAAQAVIRCGVRSLVVLDLARVGGNTGTGTDLLGAELTVTYPKLEVIVGGGVRGPEDLDKLRRCGIKGVLVASAFHDGRLRREDLSFRH